MRHKIKKHYKHALWTILASLFGIFLATIANKSFGYEKVVQDINYIPIKQADQTVAKTPETFYFIKDPSKKPKVDAEAYFVGDLDTGETILEKDKDHVFPIASVSKLMTATVSTDIQDQNETTSISKQALDTYGKNGDLYLNEKIKIHDLIYPMLLESSNDAAEAIALNSGLDNFIKAMNEKAKKIGMISTSFEDPSGLSEHNVSTAFDLFKFAEYLKKDKTDLLQLTTKKSYNNKAHNWFNTSQFLGIKGYMGGKRGYIDESRQTALSVFILPLGRDNQRNVGIALLRSPDRYKDMTSLLSYLNKNVYYGGEADADMAWVKQKELATVISEPTSISLLFGGDIMLDRGVKNSVMKNFDGDYSALFSNLDIIQKADISFANLEGPASDQGTDKHNLYSFHMSPSVIPALKGAGFSVVSVANNHMGDWGQDAFVDTISRLNENEIAYTGGGDTSVQAEQPTIIEKNGFKIGYLAFSDVGPNFLEAGTNQPGILLASNPRFDEIISNASKKVDHLVVSFHFGDEYKTKHNARQEKLAHQAIDDGARLVIGSHPHVAEDTETYKKGFIAYSLGNLIFDQAFSPETMQGMLLEVKINKDGTMSVKKDTVQSNKSFQPAKIIFGKEEKLKFK